MDTLSDMSKKNDLDNPIFLFLVLLFVVGMLWGISFGMQIARSNHCSTWGFNSFELDFDRIICMNKP